MPVKISKINPRFNRGQKSKIQIKSKKLQAKEREKLKLESSIVAKKASPTAKRSSGLELEFYDTKGKVADTVGLPKEIFGAKINNKLMAQAVRVYLANQRMGTASTKTRGEVNRSTRKIWRQKGTGRARHGSRKAPIFVGGGVVFGPRPRDFSLKLSKKMKRLALFSALSSKQKKGEIKGITGFEKLEAKTKVMASALKSLEVTDKYKKIALVLPSVKKDFENLYRASRNIEGLTVLDARLLNVYAVLDSHVLLFVKNSIKVMEEAFLAKETRNG